MRAQVPAGLNRKEAEIYSRLDLERLPHHIAIIMDGNGRWAKRRHLPRIAGHRSGVAAVRSTIETAARIGIPALTLYSFSTENWKRPKTGSQLPDEPAAALPDDGTADDDGEQHPAAVHRASAGTAAGSAGAHGVGARIHREEHRHGVDAGAELQLAHGTGGLLQRAS